MTRTTTRAAARHAALARIVARWWTAAERAAWRGDVAEAGWMRDRAEALYAAQKRHARAIREGASNAA